MSDFSNVAWSKKIIQKSIVFLYAGSKENVKI